MAAPLIALYSPVMQSGKSEVAKALVAHRGYHLVKFADPMKEILAGLYRKEGASEGLTYRMLEGDLKEKAIPQVGRSARHMLQTLGDWGRGLHPDFWVNQAMRKVEDLNASGFPVVIDDLRYPNEYEAVILRGGYPVQVVRPGTKPYTAHRSEGLLDSYPMTVLENIGTLDELRACACRLPELLTAP